MDRSRIFQTPLRLARDPGNGSVVVYTPSGERLALSAAAAAQSAKDLAQGAERAARNCARSGKVITVRFDVVRHPLGRRWQMLRGSLRGQSLRWLVAAFLLPVGLGLGTAVAIGLLLLLGAGNGGLLGLYATFGGMLLALPIAWFAAPLVMSRDEREPRAPPGSHPYLATTEPTAS